MDHHQEPAHHLAGQRAALTRLELMRLQHPRPPNDYGRLSGCMHQHARGRHCVECWCFDKRLIQRVAGCRAEHAFGASSPRSTKKGDLRADANVAVVLPEARAPRSPRERLPAGEREPESKRGCCEQDRGCAVCAEVRRQSAHRRGRAGCAARRSWFSLRAGRAALGSPCRHSAAIAATRPTRG
jgi:hypothetical protein